MGYEVTVGGYALVSKTLINNKRVKFKYFVRRESKDINDSGWVFMAHKDMKRKLSNDDFELMLYIDVVNNMYRGVLPIFNMPVGTDIQLVIENGRAYFADNATAHEIDIDKYVTLPIGSPVEMAFVEKKGFFQKLFKK